MFKKVIFSIIILAGSMPLFAVGAGQFVIYPGIGIGISSGDSKAISGAEMGLFLNSDSTMFKNAENDPTFALSLGASLDYFITDSLAITTGLSYDYTPFSMKYPKNTADNDLEVIVNYAFLTVPAGLRYYISEFVMIGGGLYYGLNISDDAELKYGSDTVNVTMKTNNDFGMFIDLGLHFSIGDTGSLLVFARYKRGLTCVYDEYDVVTDIELRALTLNTGYGITF